MADVGMQFFHERECLGVRRAQPLQRFVSLTPEHLDVDGKQLALAHYPSSAHHHALDAGAVLAEYDLAGEVVERDVVQRGEVEEHEIRLPSLLDAAELVDAERLRAAFGRSTQRLSRAHPALGWVAAHA